MNSATAGMEAYPRQMGEKKIVLSKRVLTAIGLAVIGIPAIILGGYFYFGLILLFLVVAAWEFGRLFERMDFKVSLVFLIAGVILVATARVFFPDQAAAVLTLSILACMAWHLVDYERGRNRAASDFAATSAGILYLGWIGAYMITLRTMPDGLWWLATVFPTVWLADMAAFFVGRSFGKHPLCKRLSPKKTWEGYWAGVVFGILSCIGLVILWHSLGGPAVTWWQGAALGAVLSVLTTLGDLGESMIKRQAGMKDSSNIFPGHGGVFDRIDSWLWGAALGYLFITWFLI